MTTRYLSCAETAKLVRQALKAAFPGFKFSVKSHTYSGGASIDVRWTDGPSHDAVNAIAGRFNGATFDGMVDLKSHHSSLVAGELVSMGADYIFCTQELSTARVTATDAALRQLDEVQIDNLSAKLQLGRFSIYSGQPVEVDGCDWTEFVRAAARYTLAAVMPKPVELPQRLPA